MTTMSATFHKVRLDASWSTAPVQLVNWNSRADDPPPPPEPGGPLIPGDTGYGRAASLALQTMLNDQKRGLCLNCFGLHRTWQCPEIARNLFAPVLYRCNQCGDPIDHDGECSACAEWAR